MNVKNPYYQFRSIIRAWKNAASPLAAVRRSEIARVDARSAIKDLSALIDYAIKSAPVRLQSGLVAQQALFRKMRDEQATRRRS